MILFKAVMTLFGISLNVFSLAQAATPASIADLAWMTGDWKLEDQGMVSEAHYSDAAAGSLFGVLRIVAGDKLPFFEYERIAEENGSLTLYPIPNGNIGVSFALTKLGTDTAIFENPGHDFPRTITFSIDDAGSLHILVVGTQGGQAKRQEMIMPRK